MLPKLSTGTPSGDQHRHIDPEHAPDQRRTPLAIQFDGPNNLEDHDENTSRASGADEYANRIANNKRINLPSGFAPGIASSNPPDEAAWNLTGQIDEVEETSLLSQPMDESDESEMVEHDVKVCDICGDAGREDLLAICSRCSDGAEHTYCMSDMLDKVPEGDWMCEECKFEEELRNPKQEKFAVDGNGTNLSSGQETTVNINIFPKLEMKDPEVEGTKANKETSSARASGKRQADNWEVGSAPKRRALEPTTGSPRMSTLGRLGSLSRDGSFKNLDKEKTKPGHQSSSGDHTASDMPETQDARVLTSRGSLVKSDSFNSSNAKPKVKVGDKVLQKQKSAREHVSLDTKEGAVRLMGKSMSFRSANSGRPNNPESKVKMISPKFSHVQDLKRLKEGKDQNLFERKNSFISERLWGNSTSASSPISTAKVDQKPVTRGETHSLCSASNNCEPKAVEPDSKSTSLLKGTNRVAHRCSETPASLGETNGGNRLKAAIEAAMLKKPGIYRKNRITDQHDELSSSSTNLNCEIASQDQLSNSSKMKKTFATEEVHEGQATPQNSSVDSSNQATMNNGKQFLVLPTESLHSVAADTSDVKPLMKVFPRHASASMPVLWKMSAIPEYEYIWQGGFEIHKSGLLPKFFDGIQAHLSTWASPNVIEVVNKFPHKVLLNEVPRSSTWPIQFQERGVKDDNVALYFFAKDLESYEKCYKKLLENMMKSDVALKGNLDGVELLIFPSNQLPEKSQCWNMLFFLWGVFRVKRVDCSQHVSGSLNKLCTSRDVSTVSMPSPEHKCSLEPMDMGVSVADQPCNIPVDCQAPGSMQLHCLSAEVNGDHDITASLLERKGGCMQANIGQQDSRPYSTSLSRIQMSSALSSPRKRLTSPLLAKLMDLDCEVDPELQHSVQAKTLNGCNKSEKKLLPQDTPLDRRQHSSHSLKRLRIGSEECGSDGSATAGETTPTVWHSSISQIKNEWDLEEEEGSLDRNAVLERETLMRNKTVSSRQFNGRKCPLDESVLQASSVGTSQPTQRGDVNTSSTSVASGSASKKQKTGFSGFAPSGGICDGIGSHSLMIKEEKWDEASCEEEDRVKPESSLGSGERHFFPVDPPPPMRGFGLGDNQVSWEVFSPKNDNRLLHDLAPNLELALGAEMKPPPSIKPGRILPFLVGSKVEDKKNEDHPEENLTTTTKGEEDNVSASLSLSLSFPFPPDKEQTGNAISETEQPLSERRRINTSLLLFGGFVDK